MQFKFRFLLFLAVAFSAATETTRGEIPAVFTDKISRGSGVIDMLIDVSSADLADYLQSGTLFLGVDLNEDASGNESRDSIGVAIDQLELVIQTTNGEVSFSEFYTNTTAMIQAAGATEASEYSTLFGNMGSSELTGSNSNFDISNFDDVIEVRNIQIDGEILGAELRVSFLETADNGANEDFFDYSDGFEDFAIFSSQDAAILDSANLGVAAAPSDGLVFTQYADINQAAGAPAPGVYFLAIIPLFLAVRCWTHAQEV